MCFSVAARCARHGEILKRSDESRRKNSKRSDDSPGAQKKTINFVSYEGRITRFFFLFPLSESNLPHFSFVFNRMSQSKSSAAASGSNSNAATVKRLMKTVGTKCKQGPNSSICFPVAVDGKKPLKVGKLSPTELMDVYKLAVDEKTVVVMFKLTGKGTVANCEVNANVYDVNGKVGYTVSTGLGNVNSLTLEAVRKPSTEARRVNDANRQRRDVEEDEPVDVDAEEDEQDSDVEERLRPAAEPVDDVEPVEPLEPLPQPQLDMAALVAAAVAEALNAREYANIDREQERQFQLDKDQWALDRDRERTAQLRAEAEAAEAKLAIATWEWKTAEANRVAAEKRAVAALAEEAAVAGKAELALAEARKAEAELALAQEQAKLVRPATPEPIGEAEPVRPASPKPISRTLDLGPTPIFTRKRTAESELDGPVNKAQKVDEGASASSSGAADDEPEEAMILENFHVASPDTQSFAESAVSQQKEQEDDEASE